MQKLRRHTSSCTDAASRQLLVLEMPGKRLEIHARTLLTKAACEGDMKENHHFQPPNNRVYSSR